MGLFGYSVPTPIPVPTTSLPIKPRYKAHGSKTGVSAMGFSLRKEAHATERLGGIRSRSALLTSAYPWVLVGVFNAVDLDRRFTLLNAINLLIKVHMALHKA